MKLSRIKSYQLLGSKSSFADPCFYRLGQGHGCHKFRYCVIVIETLPQSDNIVT